MYGQKKVHNVQANNKNYMTRELVTWKKTIAKNVANRYLEKLLTNNNFKQLQWRKDER